MPSSIKTIVAESNKGGGRRLWFWHSPPQFDHRLIVRSSDLVKEVSVYFKLPFNLQFIAIETWLTKA